MAVNFCPQISSEAISGNNVHNNLVIDLIKHFPGDSFENTAPFLNSSSASGSIIESFTVVEADGNYLYAATIPHTISILDISQPANPVLVFSDFIEDMRFGEAFAIVVKGTLLYLAYGSGGLRIIDVSNPYQPRVVGACETWGIANDIFIQENYAYIATAYPNYGMEIIDISNLAQPVSVGTFRSIWGDGNAVVVKNDLAYLAAGYVQFLNVSNPAAPSQISLYPTQDYSTSLALAGKYIFSSWYQRFSWGGGFDIIDVSNLSAPVKASQSFTPGRGQDVILAGNYAYFADGTSGLRIFDVADPTQPAVIGQFLVEGDAQDLDLQGDYLYMAAGDAGLYIFHLNVSSIAGYLLDSRGKPVPGQTITAGPILFSESDQKGRFQFQQLAQGTYTFTPVSSLYVYLPPYRSVMVPPNAEGQNFYVLPKPVSVVLTPGLATTLTYTDTQSLRTTLSFPTDTVSEPITITLKPAIMAGGGGFTSTGHTFTLEASKAGVSLPGFMFSAPVSLTTHYSDEDVALLIDENQQSFWWFTGMQPQDAAQSCLLPGTYNRDLENNLLSVQICQVGNFVSVGPTHQRSLPIITK